MSCKNHSRSQEMKQIAELFFRLTNKSKCIVNLRNSCTSCSLLYTSKIKEWIDNKSRTLCYALSLNEYVLHHSISVLFDLDC